VHFVTPKLKMASERFMELKHEYTQKQVGTSLNDEECIRSMNQKQIWPPNPLRQARSP
jgi:predicted metal-binding transcription factor (methanogenesis marker protein 9)